MTTTRCSETQIYEALQSLWNSPMLCPHHRCCGSLVPHTSFALPSVRVVMLLGWSISPWPLEKEALRASKDILFLPWCVWVLSLNKVLQTSSKLACDCNSTHPILPIHPIFRVEIKFVWPLSPNCFEVVSSRQTTASSRLR